MRKCCGDYLGYANYPIFEINQRDQSENVQKKRREEQINFDNVERLRRFVRKSHLYMKIYQGNTSGHKIVVERINIGDCWVSTSIF